jgi:hypothetical protein
MLRERAPGPITEILFAGRSGPETVTTSTLDCWMARVSAIRYRLALDIRSLSEVLRAEERRGQW